MNTDHEQYVVVITADHRPGPEIQVERLRQQVEGLLQGRHPEVTVFRVEGTDAREAFR